jgi:hypothetical protein
LYRSIFYRITERTHVGRNAIFLKKLELAEGSVKGAVEGDFITHHQGQRAAASLEDGGQALVVVLGLEIGGVASLGRIHFVGEQVSLNVGDAAETPAGDGHGFDEVHFDGVGGLEALDVRG